MNSLERGRIRIIIGLLALARALRADPVHHNEVLVGERALGMGGAATGLAEDAASVYYNPAGIAQMHRSSLSASFQVDAFEHVSIDNGLQAAGLHDLKDNQKPSLAVYVAAIIKVGKADKHGFRRHALAFSTVHPEQDDYSFAGSGQVQGNFADLRIDSGDDTIWRGLSYAYSWSPRLSFGTSAFWSHRNWSHREVWVLASGVQPAAEMDAQGEPVALASQTRSELRNLSFSADEAVLRFGARYDLAPEWRVGIMLQPPGIRLAASASISQERLTYGVDAPDATLPTFFRSTQSVQANSPIPWELRLGGAYLGDDVTVALDVMVHGATGSASHPVVALGAPAADPYFGRAPDFPYLVPTHYYTDVIANVACGVEGEIGDYLPWSAGVFTDFSAAPAIQGPSDAYAWPDVNRYGVSASLGWRAQGYTLQIGGALKLGSGNALVVSADPDGPTYVPSHWHDRTILFFISGYQRAAEDLAKAAASTVINVATPP